MISSKIGHSLDKPLGPFVRRVQIGPNYFTVTGFLITIVAACVVPLRIEAGGILILLGGLFDLLDGAVARVNGKVSEFGAFLDSVLDRFADAFLFASVGLYFHFSGDPTHAAISILALIGAFGVSYTRARAEGLGYSCRVGLMERPERIVLLAAGCLFPYILIPVLWTIFIGGYITVIRRIHHVFNAFAKQ